MNTITIENAIKLIRASNGAIFSVQFIKKDGTIRDMNCRLGVKKYVTGKGLAFDAEIYDLLPVYDMVKKDYRMIRLDTLRQLKLDGITYSICL